MNPDMHPPKMKVNEKQNGGGQVTVLDQRKNNTHTIQEWMLCVKKFTGLIIMMDVFKQPPPPEKPRGVGVGLP